MSGPRTVVQWPTWSSPKKFGEPWSIWIGRGDEGVSAGNCRMNRLRPSQEEPGSGSTTPVPVSDVSAPACTNGVWPPLRPVSVAQNKPSTMLSSNVQSINLPMDCTAWRFWTMRQLNGCSIPAPKSGAAKQWIKELAQKLNLQKFSFVGKHCLAGKSWKTYLEVTTVEASIPNCTVQFSKTFSCELLWRCDHWSATYNVEFVTIVE